MAASNATIAALKVSLGLDSAQFTTGLRDASASLAREAARQQKAADDLARRYANLKSSIDPVYAAQRQIGGQMKELNSLYKAGVVAGADYGRMMGQLAGQLKAVSTAQAGAEKNTKALANAGLNLGRQFADIGTQLSQPGVSPFLVLAQQGPQIVDAFQTAKQQGLSFGTVVKDLAATALRFVAAWGPGIAVAAAAGAAFLVWKKQSDDVAKAIKAAAEVSKEFADVQNSTRDALATAVEFADKYKVSNTQLAKSLDDVLISQNAAYAETLAGVDANDAAGRSAVRRAELERLLTVSILKRAAAEAAARGKEAEGEAKKARRTAGREGLLASIGKAYQGAETPGLVDPLTAGELAENKKLKELNVAETERAAKQELDYAKALNATADALMSANLVIPEAAKKKQGVSAADKAAAKAAREAAAAERELAEALAALLRSLETPGEKALREYNEATLLLRRGLDAGKISGEQFREAIDRLNPTIVDAKDAQQAWRAQFEATPADIKPVTKEVKTLTSYAQDLADAFDDVVYSFGGIGSAFKTGNFSRLTQDILSLRDGITSLLSQGLGGALTLGSAVANGIGGKGGRAIGGALGIAGAGVGLGAFAGTTAGAAALGAAGLSTAAIGTLATVAPPLAVAAAALYAAAKLFNLGGKPSNKGAGYDLVTGAITGKSRDSETEQAAVAAGDAIKGIQDALKGAGIGLTDAVTGLVIGTRDQTQIYLQSGKTLRAAVGDSQAAVDAALKELLAGATYVSDAQKKLVESALAAGKGFDAISEILGKYEAAQKIGASLADQILQLRDPQAYDTKAVKDDIAAQRDAYKKLADDGYLTADQLASLNAQLATLEGLRLDEVLKRYADSIGAAANDNLLKGITDAAAQNVLDAYSAFAQAKQAEIDGLRQAAESLKGFRRELNIGALAGRNPRDQLAATRREFDRLTALAPTDPERLNELQSVSQAFLEATRGGARNELEAARNLAAVRRATEASETAATAQADVAQQQLDTQTAMLNQLGLLTGVSQDLSTSIKAYLVALKNQTNAGIANDNGLDVNRYLAANPDLVANFQQGGILTTLGSTLEEAARAHYANYGRAEIAKGLRLPGFAKGGSFTMGGSGGIDSQLAQFWMSPGETATISHGDPMTGVSGEMRALNQQVETLTGAVVRLSGFARRSEAFMKKWDGDGLPAERVV